MSTLLLLGITREPHTQIVLSYYLSIAKINIFPQTTKYLSKKIIIFPPLCTTLLIDHLLCEQCS